LNHLKFLKRRGAPIFWNAQDYKRVGRMSAANA